MVIKYPDTWAGLERTTEWLPLRAPCGPTSYKAKTNREWLDCEAARVSKKGLIARVLVNYYDEGAVFTGRQSIVGLLS
jgi:hypothetical protein